MKQINHYLTEQQIAKLQEEKEKTGLASSEILRRAVDEYFERKANSAYADRGSVGVELLDPNEGSLDFPCLD